MAEITYFENAGEQNTEAALKIALQRFQRGDIDQIVLASTFGASAQKAARIFAGSGASILVVGEVLDGCQSPSEEICSALKAQGHRVIWGIPMGVMSTFTRDQTAAIIADTYRRVSEGFKVVCEITLIATSLGYVRPGQKVLAIAGTHRGSDTAVVATAAPFSSFNDFEVNEILCKPYKRNKK
jgi:hypothetical protein